MADAPDLGSGAARCGGSSPLSRTTSIHINYKAFRILPEGLFSIPFYFFSTTSISRFSRVRDLTTNS